MGLFISSLRCLCCTPTSQYTAPIAASAVWILGVFIMGTGMSPPLLLTLSPHSIQYSQCLYYDPRRQDKKRLSVFMAVGAMILVGAMEILLVFVSRPAYERGISAPAKLFGILSVITIAAGLLPQYWEIYKLGEVKGISYIFIAIDMLGGVLNDLSLAFSSNFDGLAAASYTSVPVSGY